MWPETLIGQELQRIGDEFNDLFIHGVSRYTTPALSLVTYYCIYTYRVGGAKDK
jgi:hypothetical protein